MHRNFSTISVCCLKKCAQLIDCKPPSLSLIHFKQRHKSHSHTCRGWDSREPNKGGYYLNHCIFRKKEIWLVLRSLMLSIGSPPPTLPFFCLLLRTHKCTLLRFKPQGKVLLHFSCSPSHAPFAEVVERVFLCCYGCRLPGVAPLDLRNPSKTLPSD